MDHLQAVRKKAASRIFLVFASVMAAGIILAYLLTSLTPLPAIASSALVLVILLLVTWIAAKKLTDYLVSPMEAIWQSVLHLSPEQTGIAAPKPENLKLGRELVTSLTAQIYQLENIAEKARVSELEMKANLSHNFIAQNLPLPLIVLDATDTVIFANEAASHYVGIAGEDMAGKNIYMALDMSFPSEDTFDQWLNNAKSKTATSVGSWERVRLNVRDNHPTRLFDLAAYYNRDNPDKNETMLVLFDHTKQYSQDEQAVSFVALSVHELRTPLTLLRGYIEVFEEEFGDKVDD